MSMIDRDIDALVAVHCLGWTPPAQKIDSRGDRGWGQHEWGGPWKFVIYGDVYDDTLPGGYADTLLEEISDAEFRARYFWKPPEGEYAEPADSFLYPPVSPAVDPMDSRRLRDKMRVDGYDLTLQITSDSVVAQYRGKGKFADWFVEECAAEEMAVALAALAVVGHPVDPADWERAL